MTIEKIYQPLELEKKWYQQWEKAGYFCPQNAQQSYCIMLPPPNVTGTLHMGHAFQNTIMDILIRYHRMQGLQTLWQGGTDHAGIATQMVVERQLNTQGLTRQEIGREPFIEKVWAWKNESGNIISQQMRRIGTSIDWTRERFTLDEGLSDAVKEVFVRLYDEKLIYRGKRLVNWDPKLHTAISDLEVVSEEEDGQLWYIRYPVKNQSNHFLIVATTRPETMLGDVAVAVHPEDHRYQHLIGQEVILPLCGRSIPIIADTFVDPEFGTGCVKITPAHDFNDHEIGKQHQLPMISIFTEDAILNTNVPLAYQGLDRFSARAKIIKDLEEAALLEKIEPHKLKVPRGEKSGEIVEPMLTDQWFMHMKPLAHEAIQAVELGNIEFIPNNWRKIYFDWMHNIQDWCISRQLWWGHRIPAWYDNQGQIYVGLSEANVREKYHLSADIALAQDNDVLDTWFSSALWPFSTLGWPTQTPELKQYYPTNVLVTGWDIIFFWVARMIMLGLKFMGDVPFRQVYIHGLIQDADGQKMSKSKGNIIDPVDLIDGIDLQSLIEKRTTSLMQSGMAKQIEKNTRKQFPQGIPSFGTDALRFTFCTLASFGREIRFDLSRIESYRNFCNKLWNAARFLLMNIEGKSLNTDTPEKFCVFDQAMISLWQKTKKQIREQLKQYRFDLVAHTLYEFIWDHYCDWYLELAKPLLAQDAYSDAQQAKTRFCLLSLLEEIQRAAHPLIPFITEEIWQKLKPFFDKDYFLRASESIMLQPYPEYDENLVDPLAEQILRWIQDCIMGVRAIRGEMNLSPGKLLKVYYQTTNDIAQHLTNHQQVIMSLAKTESFSRLEKHHIPAQCASNLIGDIEIFVSLEGLIDAQVESQRILKEIEKYQKDIDFYERKFANQGYLAKAPKEVIEKERETLDKAKIAQQKLKKNLEIIESMEFARECSRGP